MINKVMKATCYLFLIFFLTSCIDMKKAPNIQGTWELVSAVTVKGDSIYEQQLEGKRMIKIINQDHFAFLNHDQKRGEDSTAHFVAGGGSYKLAGNQYKESLEYCNFRDWEGNDFTFTITLLKDTLVQEGLEEIEELGIKQKIIEKYVRVNSGKTPNVYALPLM